MAPAVSPRHSTSGATNNPGLRLYKFDTDTGQVTNYSIILKLSFNVR